MINKILNSSLFYTMIEICAMWLGFYQIGYTSANPVLVTFLCTIIILCLYIISGEEICIGNPYKKAPALKQYLYAYMKHQEQTERAYEFVKQFVSSDEWEDANNSQIDDGTYNVVIVGRKTFFLAVGQADYKHGEWIIKSDNMSKNTHMVLCYSKK